MIGFGITPNQTCLGASGWAGCYVYDEQPAGAGWSAEFVSFGTRDRPPGLDQSFDAWLWVR